MNCCKRFKSDDRTDLYAGAPPLEALKAIILAAANHKETFPNMHFDVPRAHIHEKAQRLVLVRLPVKGRMGSDDGKKWSGEKEHERQTGRCKQLGA